MHIPRVFNLGSVNIDHVYRMPHFVRPGESLVAESYARGPGGKGFNQTVALCRCGVPVTHIGRIGAEGAWLKERLRLEGAGTDFLETGAGPTGHAIIQLDRGSQNAILVHTGANREIPDAAVAAALDTARPGDWLLAQNETSAIGPALDLAARRGLRTAWNPAPMDATALGIDLSGLDWLVVNETEACGLGGAEDPESALPALRLRAPRATIILTLGAAGVLVQSPGVDPIRVPAAPVQAVDTTAAGDTFLGFALGAFLRGFPLPEAARIGCLAAGIAVSRPGAADSIPRWNELAL